MKLKLFCFDLTLSSAYKYHTKVTYFWWFITWQKSNANFVVVFFNFHAIIKASWRFSCKNYYNDDKFAYHESYTPFANHFYCCLGYFVNECFKKKTIFFYQRKTITVAEMWKSSILLYSERCRGIIVNALLGDAFKDFLISIIHQSKMSASDLVLFHELKASQ